MEKYLIISKRLGKTNDILYYYITKDMVVEDGESMESYGVEIHKYRSDEQGVEQTQKKAVNDISSDKKTVERFISLLSDNDVTPVTLFDVVYDKIQEGYFEPAENTM